MRIEEYLPPPRSSQLQESIHNEKKGAGDYKVYREKKRRERKATVPTTKVTVFSSRDGQAVWFRSELTNPVPDH